MGIGGRFAIGLCLGATLLLVLPRSSDARRDDPLVFAALGDSFTAGPGVPPYDTSRVPESCRQSTRNYSHLAAFALGADELRDVSCTGATMDTFSEPQVKASGAVVPPQFDALGPEVDVVTVGIGGNDAGFMRLIVECFRPFGPASDSACSPEHGASGDPMAQRIARAGEEMSEVLIDIEALAPNASVFVVGYPASLPHDASSCWPYLPIRQVDMPYLVAMLEELNSTLAERAAAHGATFIDTYTPSIGHDACKAPGTAWVNSTRVLPPDVPLHPNELGLAATARVVETTVRAHLVEALLRAEPATR